MVDKKGIILIIVLIIIVVFTVFSASMVSRSLSERSLAERSLISKQAFWLAEAGVNQALKSLRTDYSVANIPATALGQGGYSVTIIVDPSDNSQRIVTARGFIPFIAPFRAERILEVVMKKFPKIPDNFYDNAIYASGDVVLKGVSYDVTGNVRYGDTVDGDASKIIGGTIAPNPQQDPSIAPLALLDFEQLRTISKGQGNYHDAGSLDGPFPASFWYDQLNGIPNVVFMEGSFVIKGNAVVGGFYVVGGEVTYDATISGNVTVDGCIYTRGNFTIKGGGNALNIDGGVWSGDTATLDGNAKITYNAAYMNAIKGLGINTSVQIVSWKDTQNPYDLVP